MSSEIHYTENSKLHPSAKEHQLARNISSKVPPHSTAKNDLENKNDHKMVKQTHHNDTDDEADETDSSITFLINSSNRTCNMQL